MSDIYESLLQRGDAAADEIIELTEKTHGSVYNALSVALEFFYLCARHEKHAERLKLSLLERQIRHHRDLDLAGKVAKLFFARRHYRINVYRYAACLRHAQEYSISPKKMRAFMIEEGGVAGVNASRIAFRGNSVSSQAGEKEKQHRTLKLVGQFAFPEDGVFTISLRARGDGKFDVVKINGAQVRPPRKLAKSEQPAHAL